MLKTTCERSAGVDIGVKQTVSCEGFKPHNRH